MESTQHETICFLGDWLPTRALNVAQLVPGAATVANLECAFTDQRVDSTKAHTAVLGRDALSHVAAANFAALNLANNHALDAGEAALDVTLLHLRDRCPAQLFGLAESPFAELRIAGKAVAVIGCIEPCRSRGCRLFPQEQVESLLGRLRSAYDRLYVFCHWGKEGEYAGHPSPAQRRLARTWLRAGADGVIGHHSHTIQGWERFGRRRVYYSLGNLDFDHPEGRAYPATRRGLAVTVRPDRGGDQWSHRFLGVEHAPAWLTGGEAELAHWRLDALCGDLNRSWTPWRWARAVGPIYIPKSRRSWRRRLKDNPLRTLPVWLAWSLRPNNMLLRLGSLAAPRRERAA
jgi:poly-gamma-glutamate synthesis protein (capsule biosynthesis protein)